MSKISLVIATEFKTRVFKKSFILLTLLMPILFAAVVITPVFLSQMEEDIKLIALVDNDGRFGNLWEKSSEYDIEIIAPNEHPDTTHNKCVNGTYAASIIINTKQATDSISDLVSLTLFSDKTLPKSTVKYIEQTISSHITSERLAKLAEPQLLSAIQNAECNIKAKTIKTDEDGNISDTANSEAASAIGMIATVLIYMFIFISGAQVMNAVMQEKTNRIVEVMLSAIKPWELMWGKLIAVALVCLTQILIWAIFTITIAGTAIALMNIGDISSASETLVAQQTSHIPSELGIFQGIDWVNIGFWFLLYFIAGYLLYAAMFAAMGAAVENETDTQQFMLPITAIVLFALYAGIFSAENPDGTLAFWCSIIPLTSPIVMMVRLPFGVSWWELTLSYTLLIGSVFAMAWICSKIYRVGILMYGKKPSWKELWKWLKY